MNQNKVTTYGIISNIENLSKDITRNWKVIVRENCLSKKSKTKRSQDLRALYFTVKCMGDRRVSYKLDQLASNLGFKSRKDFMDSPIFKSSHYHLIFKLSELRQMHFNLGEIPTMSVTEKKKKSNRRRYTEVFSEDWIISEMERIQVQMNKISAELDVINNSVFTTDCGYPWETDPFSVSTMLS